MLFAIPHAEAVAVMHFDIAKDPTLRKPEMMLTRVRDDTMTFRPSNRLIRATMENHKNVLHMWNEMGSNDAQYTMVGNLDWAFCAPVNDRSCAGWCLYAAGSTSDGTASRQQLLADLRSTQVLAQFVGSISQVRLLEHQAAEMAQYFSPTIVNALKRDSSKLEPREQDVSVLFCDLRGFSWRVDRDKHQLREIFDRVNRALGVMTQNIHKFEGAISDFQGDAALAFWGWPQALEDGPLSACRAALSMLSEFKEAYESDDESTVDGFQVGIGIGHGPAIAGRMGAAEQVKVGVFGPIVNMTSRLEGLTKHFRVPIIMNDVTTDFVKQHMSRDEARCRKLAMVRPMGVKSATMISELLPAAETPGTVSDEEIAKHEEAVDAFIEGEWTKSLDIFASLAVADRAKDYLMWYMANQKFEVPRDWDGVLNFNTK
jgi:adenylate cyclase